MSGFANPIRRPTPCCATAWTPADSGDPRVARRIVRMAVPPRGVLVAVVARREVEADALDRSLDEERLVGVDQLLVDRDEELAADDDERRLAPRVRDDRGVAVGE